MSEAKHTVLMGMSSSHQTRTTRRTLGCRHEVTIEPNPVGCEGVDPGRVDGCTVTTDVLPQIMAMNENHMWQAHDPTVGGGTE